jgi:murein DD-endopeptidase MepM/ murein hydrolase activator NlpD
MLARTGRWALVALPALLVATLAVPASAAVDPSEFKFPQETDKTQFFSSFGQPRSGGRWHRGNDLMAPKMTEVYAIAPGVVKWARTASLGGRYIAIDHGDGWESYYMHLNNDIPGTDSGRADWSYTLAPGVFEGAQVEAGQLIGWVGDSGNAEWTGPHTHFELHHNGRAIDPYPYLLPAMIRDEALRLAEEAKQHVEEALATLEELSYDIR